MAGKIFINYRREDSTGTAARLHDRLAQEFGRENLFVDVVGVDLKARLSNQVAACQVFLTVIGPNWLDAKDEAGQRRLHHPDDFVAVEIAAALARNICIIPVLVDGARMPKLSWLPDSLKPLAGCQAVEVRQPHFDRDAEALVERVREALNAGSVGLRSWRGTAVAGVAAAAGLLLVGWIGLYWMDISVWPPGAETQDASNAKAQAEAEAKRKSEEAEQQRLATLKAEQERQTKAAAEAEAKRKSEEAEQQRVAALRAEQEERNRAEAEARARYAALISQGNADSKAGDYDRAIAAYNEAIQLDPKSALAYEAGATRMQTKATMTEPSPILTRRFDSIPKALSPSEAGASLMQTKATMTEPSPILTRRSDSTPKAPSPLGAGATLMQTKTNMTEPSPITTRRSVSIPKALSPLGTGALLMRIKATTIEPSLITARRSDLIPRALSPLATGAFLMRTKATIIEPLSITTKRSDLIPTMLSLFAIEEEQSGISTT